MGVQGRETGEEGEKGPWGREREGGEVSTGE